MRWMIVMMLFAAAAQAQPRRIYLAPDDHTDYMWSASEEVYQAAFVEMIDYYLDLADKTQQSPADFQSRWNCDGSLWLRAYQQRRTPEQFARLIGRIKDGHISVALNPLAICYGGTPAEAVLRSMYYAGSIERKHGVKFPLAIAMENQTVPYGLGQLWAGCGAKYSWRGVCGCASKLSGYDQWDHPLYWWTGADGSRILMKWYPMMWDNKSLGGYAEARQPRQAIARVTTDKAFLAKYPYEVAGIFGKGWDDVKTTTSEFVDVAREMSRDGRRVIVSNEVDFFEDIEKTDAAKKIPELACSFGNEWELLTASLAETSASVKRSIERLRAAEALAVLAIQADPAFAAEYETRRVEREQVWLNLGLYFEHDWTADGPVSRSDRAKWQRRLAEEIAAYVDWLEAEGTKASRHEGTEWSVSIFNPLGWPRTDVVDVAVDGEGPWIARRGETTLSSQSVNVDGKPRLRVLVLDVPAMGWTTISISPGDVAAARPAVVAKEDGTLETNRYRVKVEPCGAISQVFDRLHNDRPLLAEIDGRLANSLGTGRAGTIRVENAGPVCATIVATSDEPVKHTSRITVFNGLDRINIENRIEQNFSQVLTWSFPFNVDHPTLRHEEVGAILTAKLTTEGGHYAPSFARYDWLTLNHFADMGNDSMGMILSNADCYFMRAGRSTLKKLDTTTPLLSVLAGGQVDGNKLGIQKQGGDSLFIQRFALTPRNAYDAAAAMRFAMEHQNPLLAIRRQPTPSGTIANVDHPYVMLWAVKPSEDDPRRSLIVRVWNVSDQPTDATLRMPFTIGTAWETTHIETDVAKLPVNGNAVPLSLGKWQWKTIRITR